MVPFGLTNAPAVAVRIGNRLFYDMIDNFVVIFMDDVLVYSKTVEDHAQHLDLVFQRMKDNNFYVHPGKCSFFLDSVIYLGIQINASGVSIPDTGKQAVLDWPVPEVNASPLKTNKKRPTEPSAQSGEARGPRHPGRSPNPLLLHPNSLT